MRGRLLSGLVARLVLQGFGRLLVALRALSFRGLLVTQGCNRWLGMGGESTGGVLWQGPNAWAGGSWVGGILVDA